jgi:hypothetical protein
MGWEQAFDLIDRAVDGWWSGDAEILPPIRISRRELQRCWIARSRHHLRSGRIPSAIMELLTHQFWISPAYNLYRTLKSRTRAWGSSRKTIG